MEYAYAALILSEAEAELDEHNITAVLEAAGLSVEESRVKALVAALEGVDLAEIRAEASAAAPVEIGSGDADLECAEDDEPADAGESAADTEDTGAAEQRPADGDAVLGHEPADADELVPVDTEGGGRSAGERTARADDAGDSTAQPDADEMSATAPGETRVDSRDRKSPGGS